MAADDAMMEPMLSINSSKQASK